MRPFTFLTISATLALSGCVSYNNVAPTGNLKLNADEGLVIIGVPPGARLSFHSGDITDGKFTQDRLPEGISGYSEDGYFVRKLKATQDGRGYGMVSLTLNRVFAPGCGQKMAVLSVKPGQVQYYGNFSFVNKGNSVGIRYDSDPASARQYITNSFPNLALPFEDGIAQSLEQGFCVKGGGTTYIPIFIPGR